MSTGQSNEPHKRDWLWLLLTMAIYSVLIVRVVGTRDYWPNADSGAFISAGIAIQQGLGVRDITSPPARPTQGWSNIPTWIQNDEQAMAKPNWPFFGQYPPGLPLLLAPLIALGSGAYIYLQALTIFCGALALILLYVWRYELLPGYWQATLLTTAVSQMTLYATRVQSEVVMLPIIIVALLCVLRARRSTNQYVKWGCLAALVMFAAAVLHGRSIFLAGAMLLCLVVIRRVSLLKRAFVALAMITMGIAPTLLFHKHATWAERGGFGASSPLLRKDSNDFDTKLTHVQLAKQVVKRVLRAGYKTFHSTMIVHEHTSWSQRYTVGVVFWVLMTIGLWQAVRRGAGVVSFCTLAYILGCVVSPWYGTRYVNYVQPFFNYLALAALLSIVVLVCRNRQELKRVFTVSACLVMVVMYSRSWIESTPERDWWCTVPHRAHAHLLNAAQALPENTVILVEGDPFSFALQSGRAVVSLTKREWKNMAANRYLSHGTGVALIDENSPMKHPIDDMPLEDKLERVAGYDASYDTQFIVVDGTEIHVGLIGVTIDTLPLTTENHDDQIFSPRIHPRWFEVRPQDAVTISSRVFPQGTAKLSGDSNNED